MLKRKRKDDSPINWETLAKNLRLTIDTAYNNTNDPLWDACLKCGVWCSLNSEIHNSNTCLLCERTFCKDCAAIWCPLDQNEFDYGNCRDCINNPKKEKLRIDIKQ